MRSDPREVETLSKAHAAYVLAIGDDALEELKGRVHAIETVSGNQRICKDSLLMRSQSAKA